MKKVLHIQPMHSRQLKLPNHLAHIKDYFRLRKVSVTDKMLKELYLSHQLSINPKLSVDI